MKIIYVTDIHGDKWKYNRLFEVAKSFKADMVINGGDMLPMTANLYNQGKFISSFLESYFLQFESAGIYYLCLLGNDDLRMFDDLFEKTCNKFQYVVSTAQKKFEIEGYTFIGMNWIADCPFQLKDRCRMDTYDYVFQKQLGNGLLSKPEGLQEIDDWFSYAKTLPTVEDELSSLVRPDDMANTVYVIHMPPYKLGLDVCFDGREVGSRAIYDFLLQNQPKLSLHGHIHESPEVSRKWFAKLKNTICIQPGQSGRLTYVTIDLSSMEFNRIKI